MSFYLVGCQRSGTTLLRLILNSHSKITCFDEAVAYNSFLGLEDPSAKNDCKEIFGYKIPRFTEQLLSTVVCDPDYPHIPQFFSKDDQIIFISRDVLDVISSMKSLIFSDGVSWLQKYGVDILKFKMKDQSFARQYQSQIKLVEKSQYSDATVGALYWKYKNDSLFEYQKQGLNLVSVLYENLVSSPENEIQKIVDFLGVEFEDALLNHHQQQHGELEPDGKAIGGTDPARAISVSSIGKHIGNLSQSEIQIIQEIAESTQVNLAHV
ncbi:MAG: sulfotransferase [Planctomycetota bacterium]